MHMRAKDNFHCIERNSLDIFLDIYFCVPQKKAKSYRFWINDGKWWEIIIIIIIIIIILSEPFL